MEEHQVTVDGETMPLNEPFFVIATQNPVEMAGTFPLPQAQLDRFMIQLSLGYPEEEAELDLLERYVKKGNTLSSLQAVCDAQTLLEMRQACEQVTVHRSILEYARNIAKRTREEKKLALSQYSWSDRVNLYGTCVCGSVRRRICDTGPDQGTGAACICASYYQ